MKIVPASFEKRQKLPADKFADPVNRRFYIESSEDLDKLKGRIRRLTNRDEIRQTALKIASKNSLEIPADLMFPWEDEEESENISEVAEEVEIKSEDAAAKVEHSNSDKFVYLPTGTYKVNDVITLPKEFKIIGGAVVDK